MRALIRYLQRLRSYWSTGSNRSQRIYLLSPSVETPIPNNESATAQGRGQRELHSYDFQSVSKESSITDSSESWTRDGDLLEGHTKETRIVTASGRVVESAEEIIAICSVCGLGEDIAIHSHLSGRTLCRSCARQFESPDGRTYIVTPGEQRLLLETQDTWALYDHRRQ